MPISDVDKRDRTTMVSMNSSALRKIPNQDWQIISSTDKKKSSTKLKITLDNETTEQELSIVLVDRLGSIITPIDNEIKEPKRSAKTQSVTPQKSRKDPKDNSEDELIAEVHLPSSRKNQVASEKIILRFKFNREKMTREWQLLIGDPYTLKKANHFWYVNYSLWSALGVLLAAGLDDLNWMVFIPVAATLVLMSVVASRLPQRLQPSVKIADTLVIVVSGVRDVARITATGALFYWAYMNSGALAMGVGANDIILGAAIDPYFWITTAVAGAMCAYLKYKAAQSELSCGAKRIEQGIRGAYMACSASTMTIMTFDCVVRLWADTASSGYHLILADPVVATVVFSVIAIAVMAAAYWGAHSLRDPELEKIKRPAAAATKFEQCDQVLLNIRMMFMPMAVIASITHPPLILAGVGFALAYLTYTHIQAKTGNQTMACEHRQGFFNRCGRKADTQAESSSTDESIALLSSVDDNDDDSDSVRVVTVETPSNSFG